MRARLPLILVLVTFLALSMSLAAAQAAKGNVAAGQKAYETTCVTCHGKDGSGNTPMGKTMKAGDLRSDAVQKQADADLIKTISTGKGKMVGYEKTLGAAKIHDIVAYIRTLKK